MAPKEPDLARGNKPDQDEPYEETALDKLVDTTQNFFGVNDPDDEDERIHERETKEAEDDFYRPFQEMPDTDAGNVPEEKKTEQRNRTTGEKRIIRDSDKY